jgi:quercetin dioxygenase-like cupin family protein
MAEYQSGNVFIREMRFEGMKPVEGHAHNFDHTTYCAKGSMKVEALDNVGKTLRSTTVSAEDGLNWVLIEAGVCHRITPLVEGTLGHCIYAHRTPQGEVVQQYTGWGPAYV